MLVQDTTHPPLQVAAASAVIEDDLGYRAYHSKLAIQTLHTYQRGTRGCVYEIAAGGSEWMRRLSQEHRS